MNEDELKYAMAKQLPTAKYIVTDYGDVPIDREFREVLGEYFEVRLAALKMKKMGMGCSHNHNSDY